MPETKTAAQEGEEPAKDESAENDAAETAEPADEAEPAEETPAVEAKEPAETKEPAEAKPATPDEQQKIAVRQENKRLQDEYDAAVKAGKDKVKELNDRFADWYFIISDDVYKKIHLGRADIIMKKPVESTDELGNLKDLQNGLGLPPAQPAVP